MYTSEVELIDTLRTIQKDGLLGKVFVAIRIFKKGSVVNRGQW